MSDLSSQLAFWSTDASLPTECQAVLEDGSREIARLQRELEEARATIAALRGELIDSIGANTTLVEALEVAHSDVARLNLERLTAVAELGEATKALRTSRALSAMVQDQRSLLRGLLELAQPWVERGLNDHPAPTSDDLALLAEIAQAVGKAHA